MYNKDNIEGIVFLVNTSSYKVGAINCNFCELTNTNGNWKDSNYPLSNIISCLNNGSYKVLKQPYRIHECW